MPLVAAIWVIVASAMVYQGQSQVREGGRCLSLFGIVAVLAVWAALVQLFIERGAWFLVSLLALIWFARSEEHTSELQSLMRISYAVFCLNKTQEHTPRHNEQQ